MSTKDKHNSRSRSCFNFQPSDISSNRRKKSLGNSTDRSFGFCATCTSSKPEDSKSSQENISINTEHTNKLCIIPSTNYCGLLLPKGIELSKKPIFSHYSKILKFPICDTFSCKTETLCIKKDRVCISNWVNVKEILKTFHKGSPFKGTQVIQKTDQKENIELPNILNNKEKTTKAEPQSENLKTGDSAELPYTRDSKAEGIIKNHINESLVNKNINYSQKTFELQKDTGEYQHTTFENLRTEYFLLNPGQNAKNNDFNPAVLLNEEIGKNQKIQDSFVEEELQNIYRKLCIVNSTPLSTSKQNFENDEIFACEEDDPIPHIVHSSDLIASKDIWSKRSQQFYNKKIKEIIPLPKSSAKKLNKKFESTFWDLRTPLARKLLICKQMGTENKISLEHALTATGYLTSPQLFYSSNTNGMIDCNDKALPMNSIINLNILSSFVQTKVLLITCGFEHCTVLTQLGSVASWGYGGSGCLGHGNYVSYTSPKIVKELPSNIIHIESGAYHMSAICTNGDLYMWGRSDVGQLGIDTRKLQKDTMGWVSLFPQLVENLRGEVKRISNGEAHTLVLTKDGNVLSSGWGQHGQLGQGRETEICFEFRPIRELSNISSISAGSLFSLALNNNGKVFAWGCGEQGQLGARAWPDKNKKEIYSPVKIKGLSKEFVKEICCGESNILCYCKSGKIYGWGQGYYDKNNASGIDKKESNREFMTIINKIDPCQYWIIKCQKELSFIVFFSINIIKF